MYPLGSFILMGIAAFIVATSYSALLLGFALGLTAPVLIGAGVIFIQARLTPGENGVTSGLGALRLFWKYRGLYGSSFFLVPLSAGLFSAYGIFARKLFIYGDFS